ncbi:hypothetical protein [Arthrobacter sp. MYb213]|uniref:hypothetical protein n=1 Tax=Arthrobacter sp. MYb213 TaxID=1848595 RepID=UPI000CFC5A29|nr:hypothetical protein [Arthrobacter sp. MYb213]PRB69352.1 hypothetical protein CQ011_11255 [Arthrobacter sp. MYb213]
MAIKSSNIEAITKATGTPWEQWVEQLESAGAKELSHKPLASMIYQLMPADLENPGWWAQSVAIAYEQHIGRRVPGQASDGSFKGSVSTTLSMDLEGALQSWVGTVAEFSVFNGAQLTAEPAVSGSEKWRYWKAQFSDGSRVSVNITMKGSKASVSADHAKLANPQDLEGWKSFWRQILATISS